MAVAKCGDRKDRCVFFPGVLSREQSCFGDAPVFHIYKKCLNLDSRLESEGPELSSVVQLDVKFVCVWKDTVSCKTVLIGVFLFPPQVCVRRSPNYHVTPKH